MKKSKKFLVSMLSVFGAVILAGCGDNKSGEAQENVSAPSAQNAQENQESEEMEDSAHMKKEESMQEDDGAMKSDSTSSYADGSYNATGTYTSPGGAEEVNIRLTIEGNVITQAESDVSATHKISKKRQEAFAEGLAAVVVGKNLDEVSVDVIGGASLTTQGFERALEKIKEEARQ